MKPQEKPEMKPEIKKTCNCGPECDCGCNEGKECRCGSHCRCGHGCGGKIIVLLLVFLAGMGFNELLHGCFGRCPNRGMRPAPMMSMHHKMMPNPGEAASTVVIINTDGSADVKHSAKCGCHKHFKDMKKKHPHHGNKHLAPQGEVSAAEQTAAE